MVITNLRGGIGNQLFRYATGYSLAKELKAPLRIDPRSFKHIDASQARREFSLGTLSISAKCISGLDRILLTRSMPNPKPLRRILCNVAQVLRVPDIQILRDKGLGFDPSLKLATSNCYLDGDWQSERYFLAHRLPLLEEFKFRTPPGQTNLEMLKRIADQPSVSVHVRRGDYTSPNQPNAPLPLSYYESAMEWMQSRLAGAKYFVFSDDPAWVRSNLKMPDGTTFITHNVGIRDTEDLRLMSNCNHFIIANSTFSWWGAWLGQSPDKIVIAPSRWYPKPHPSEKDLVPESWVRI